MTVLIKFQIGVIFGFLAILSRHINCVVNILTISDNCFAELPVEFMTPLPDKSVVEKESFTLECEVSKPNKPATWSKDGKPLEPSDRVQMFVDGTKHTLIVNNSILDDEAKYTITVEEAESTGNVTVQGVYLLVYRP